MSSMVVVRDEGGSQHEILDTCLSGESPAEREGCLNFASHLRRLVDELIENKQNEEIFHRPIFAITETINLSLEWGSCLPANLGSCVRLKIQDAEFTKALVKLESEGENSLPALATIAFLRAAQAVVGEALVAVANSSVAVSSAGDAQLTMPRRTQGDVAEVEGLQELVKESNAEGLINAASRFWNILSTGSSEDVNSVLGTLTSALQSSLKGPRSVQPDVAMRRFYEELFSARSSKLYEEVSLLHARKLFKTCLPLLKKYYQSEDGLSPAEVKQDNNPKAFWLQQRASVQYPPELLPDT